MSNVIYLNEDKRLKMSNGFTEVFIHVLVLSGSRIAKTEREQEFIVWLAEHDQNIVGRGTVGFSIKDFPWEKETFIKDKKFLLEVIKDTKLKTNWEILGYKTNEEILFSFLDQFYQLVADFDENSISKTIYLEWEEACVESKLKTKDGFKKCPIHNVLLSSTGCILCNFYDELIV